MEYNAFKEQTLFHMAREKYRVRFAFGGKRCINPQSKVVTSGGIKEFGDILHGDQLLSWDQKANQFSFHQSTASFPKAKSHGYRVIHERGEFVASAEHRIFCSQGTYRSLEDIFFAFRLDANDPKLSFLSPEQSIEELYPKLSLANVSYSIEKLLNFLKNYQFCNHSNGQLLHAFQAADQALSRPLSYVRESFQLSDPSFSLSQDALDRRRLRRIRLDQYNAQTSNWDVSNLFLSLFDFVLGDQKIFDIFGRCQRKGQLLPLFLELLNRFQKDLLLNQYADQEFFSSCESNILAIEQVSTQWWWDVTVNQTHNYISEGAIHHNSGKTEVGAVEGTIFSQCQIGFTDKRGIDPYIGVIIAPTNDMLRRLSMAKFLAYAKPFDYDFNSTFQEVRFPNGSLIYGISGEKPARLEGIKANWIWIDEVLQCKEQLFLEAKARVADSKGHIWCTGSLGVQFNNPKGHWAYRYAKEKADENTWCIEWPTVNNPYFPKEEINTLKETLDPRTFRQMFEIDWNVPGSALVYENFDDSNLVRGFVPDPKHEIYCSIDWGYAHPMACLFFAYDRSNDRVTLFDEIVSSRLTLDVLYDRIIAKGYRIEAWICDSAGGQTREQSGKSNIRWFHEKGIVFKRRKGLIADGIPIVRSYIRDGKGRVKFFVDEVRCPQSIDQLKNYSYPEKDGTLTGEKPIKIDDDCPDAIRYFFVNILDKRLKKKTRVATFM